MAEIFIKKMKHIPKKINENYYAMIIKDGKKVLELASGILPKRLDSGEELVIINNDGIEVNIKLNNVKIILKIVAFPGDDLAKQLTECNIDDRYVFEQCQKVLAKINDIDSLDSEELRVMISNRLNFSIGLRCERVTIENTILDKDEEELELTAVDLEDLDEDLFNDSEKDEVGTEDHYRAVDEDGADPFSQENLYNDRISRTSSKEADLRPLREKFGVSAVRLNDSIGLKEGYFVPYEIEKLLKPEFGVLSGMKRKNTVYKKHLIDMIEGIIKKFGEYISDNYKVNISKMPSAIRVEKSLNFCISQIKQFPDCNDFKLLKKKEKSELISSYIVLVDCAYELVDSFNILLKTQPDDSDEYEFSLSGVQEGTMNFRSIVTKNINRKV